MKINKLKGKLIIKLSILEKIFSIHGDMEIDMKNIVTIDDGRPPLWTPWWDIRFPGTFIPVIARLGTYYTRRGKEFWLWTRGKKYEYTVELEDENYDRIVISTNQKLEITLPNK